MVATSLANDLLALVALLDLLYLEAYHMDACDSL